jgi:hypothetical protein
LDKENVIHIYNEDYSSIKKNEIMLFAGKDRTGDYYIK